MEPDWGMSLVAHWQEIWVLAVGFVLAMIESPGARIVVAVCLGIGVIFAVAIRILHKKTGPEVTSILPVPPLIK